MRLRLASSVTVLVAASLVVAGCTSNETDPPDPTSDPGETSSGGGAGDVYVNLGFDPPFVENFNPFAPSSAFGTRTVYEPLFFLNSSQDASAEYEPLLGTSFEFSEDGTVLTIQTREGVTWSDGEPFTAGDVAFTFNFLLENPALNTGGWTGTAEVTGENEVTISYPEANIVAAQSSLATQIIIPEHIWADFDDPATETNPDPVGTGPFLPDEFSSQTYSFRANPDYWEEGKPEIAGFRIIGTGGDAAADAILDGQVTWYNGTFPNPDELFAANPDVLNFGTTGGQLALITCSNAELGCTGAQTDPAVRYAIYHAMDREQLDALAFNHTSGEISPTFATIPRDEVWISDAIDEPVAPMNADQDLATQILEDAGYTLGSDGIYEKDGERLSFEVKTVDGWIDWTNAANTLAEQLRPVGIELNTTLISHNAWSTDLNQGSFELMVHSLGSNTAVEPFSLYRNWFGTSSTAPVGESATADGYARFSNADVDAALEILQNSLDDQVRAEQYAVIQEAIVEDLPYIPIAYLPGWSQVNTSQIDNWPTPDNAYAASQWWVNPDAAILLKRLTVK